MNQTTKRLAVLTMATTMLLGESTYAIFGLGEEKARQIPQEGAPLVQDVEIRTYRGIPYQGQFWGSDKEGEDMTFTVVDQPKKGKVEVDGVNFVYTPHADATGDDAFTYAATDSSGAVSSPATVTITIEKVRSGVMYSDTDEATAAAAQALVEEGIFVGAKIGDNYYFEPQRQVCRSEFLAMALETAQREVTAVTMTGFCDDKSIPVWAKAYAAAGVADGIVQGKATEEGAAFYGEDAITFNEAATILNRVLDMGDVELEVWYADRQAVPTWAAQAVGNMEALNVLSVGSFGSSAMESIVTRADAARMLCAARTLLDGEEEPGGFWRFLR